MKFEKLKSGMKVYDVGRHKMGNTTMSTVAVWPVFVREVDVASRTVVASWNSNPEKTFYEKSVKGWREKKPMLICSAMGPCRLATREEQQTARAAAGAA